MGRFHRERIGIVRTSLLCLAIGVLSILPPAAFAETLLRDDFDGDRVSAGRWHIPTWVSPTDGSVVGRTQFRFTQNASLPSIEDGNAVIVVETFNPETVSFLGTDLRSNQSFALGKGIHVIVRARMNTATPGIVGGIFLYGLKPGSTSYHDEIDFELLTNHPDAVQTNIYADEQLGIGNVQFVPYASGSITDYHTYEIKWQPHRVSWMIDGQVVRTDTRHVPAGPMTFHLNIWVPDPGWPAAYGANLQPATSAGANQAFSMSVDSVVIQSIE
jgi:beta-glucanase (GH16 family)